MRWNFCNPTSGFVAGEQKLFFPCEVGCNLLTVIDREIGKPNDSNPLYCVKLEWVTSMYFGRRKPASPNKVK